MVRKSSNPESFFGRVSRRLVMFLPCLLVCGLSCGAGDREAIDRLMETRAQALSARDLSLYMSCISREYADPGWTYEAMEADVSRLMERTKKVTVRFSGRRISMESMKATVYQNIAMRIEGGGHKEKVLRGRERILVRKNGNGWKIYGGLHGG